MGGAGDKVSFSFLFAVRVDNSDASTGFTDAIRAWCLLYCTEGREQLFSSWSSLFCFVFCLQGYHITGAVLYSISLPLH